MITRSFEDDFGWVARLEERPDGSVHGSVITCDGYPVWDKVLPDMETAKARLDQLWPRFREVA